MVEKVCLHCKKKFFVKPGRAKKARFCSVECSKVAEVEKNCLVCNSVFRAKAAVEKHAKYCSNHCRVRSGPLSFICENCGKNFLGRSGRKETAKFCSFECSMDSKRREFTCESCSTSFIVPNSSNKIRFCSPQCCGVFLDTSEWTRCEWCSSDFLVKQSHLERRKYCSVECSNQASQIKRDYIEPLSVPGAKWIQLGYNKFALVDEIDFKRLSNRLWSCHKGYAVSRGKDNDEVVFISMHRYILRLNSRDPEVDHVNGDRLDNRKSNLRLATRALNAANRINRGSGSNSGYRGVYKTKNNYFTSMITHEQQQIYLGTYNDIRFAAEAYDEAARDYFGQYARLNFPKPGEQQA